MAGLHLVLSANNLFRHEERIVVQTLHEPFKADSSSVSCNVRLSDSAERLIVCSNMVAV